MKQYKIAFELSPKIWQFGIHLNNCPRTGETIFIDGDTYIVQSIFHEANKPYTTLIVTTNNP